MDEGTREEIQTFAGHLLAELYAAEDAFRHGKMEKAAYLKRVEVIKRRARSGNDSFARAMEQLQMTFTATMAQAEELRA